MTITGKTTTESKLAIEFLGVNRFTKEVTVRIMPEHGESKVRVFKPNDTWNYTFRLESEVTA